MKIPKYRKHSSRDIALVQWNGRRHYLPGKHNSRESLDAYRRFIQQVVAAEPPGELPEASGLTLAGMIAAFLEHAKRRYASGARGEYANCRYALLPLAAAHGSIRAVEFGPRRLKAWRLELIPKHARQYINQQLAKIKRAFRWAASEELIPASVYQAINTVQGLREGETVAREAEKRKPVPWGDVEPVLAELSQTVADMVRIQWHTAARSGSICRATPGQFDRSKKGLWLWRPRHKTESIGRELVIPIGPKCQKILKPYLEGRPADAPLFDPRIQRANRRYGSRYTTSSYYRAIARAIERVNAAREEQAEKLHGDKSKAKLIDPWFPHQLRHSKGQEVRERYGLEGAQAHLGHDSMEATEIYSARRLELAKQIAKETG